MRLIGTMTVWLDGEAVRPPSSRRAWALLAWLTLHPGLHARATLAATFWPDVVDSSARANLRSAVWALRKSLGSRSAQYVHFDRDRLGLRDDAAIRTDIREVSDLVAAGRLREAAELGVGELLTDLPDEWLLEARDTYRQDMTTLLESLAVEADAAGDPLEAIGWTRRQVELDPLAELPQRRLMTRLAASGDRAAATGVYHRLRGALARDLGIAPSFETEQLAWSLMSATPRQTGAARPDLQFAWTLSAREGGWTRVSVHVDIPSSRTRRPAGQRELISAALDGLADLAARTQPGR